MKLTKYFMPFAALALLASCSNDNLDAPAGGEQQLPADGAMYAAFRINIPTTPGSKAFDSFQDGDNSAEFAASTGKIYLWTEDNDKSDYTFFKSASLASLAWDKNSDDNITTSSTTATAQFTGIVPTTKYYGLVALNVEGTDFPEPTAQQKFSAWKKIAHSQAGSLGAFVMSSAPGSSTTIENANGIGTLVEIEGSKFSTSQANLEEAAKFYVQREVAKVTLAAGEGKDLTKFEVTMPEEEESADPKVQDIVRFDFWELDNKNTVVYPVQNVEAFDSWIGFAGVTVGSFTSNSTSFNRVYWAEDPNYNGTLESYETANENSSPFTKLTSTTAVSNKITDIFYPMENTMSAPYMHRGQTTTAVLQATYFINPTDADNLPKEGTSFITYGVLKYEVPSTITPLVSSGQTQVKLNTVFDDATSESKPKSDLATVMEKLGVTSGDILVDYYHKGIMYYAIPIRHFDDTESPKLNDQSTGGANWNQWVNDSYVYNNKYTGRFGLVRNNWYEMQINSVSGFGTPGLPPYEPEDPDDPKNDKYYINASINILAWAKRTTGYDL